jgi:nucleotide-binding universal stress UspA family protein
MYKKILFATDLSDASKPASKHIAALREAMAEEIVILHVLKEDSYLYFIEAFSKIDVEKFDRDLWNLVLQEMRPIAYSFTYAGFKVKVAIVRGIASEQILRIADEEDVSLIVLGAHVSCIKKLLPWSTSCVVARKSKRPVLVIGRQSGNH